MGQAGVPPMLNLQRDSVLLTVGTFINEATDIEDVVCIYNGILLNHKNEWNNVICSNMWRRQWQPTPVPLPGKSHGWRRLVGWSPWGCKESDTTERLHFHFSLSCTGEGNGNPLRCSCLENPRDREAWWAASMGSHRVGHDWRYLAAAATAAAATQMDLKIITLSEVSQNEKDKSSCVCET